MDKKLLEILVCPRCKGKLEYDKSNHRLICQADKLAYPVKDGMPVLIVEEAESLEAATSQDQA